MSARRIFIVVVIVAVLALIAIFIFGRLSSPEETTAEATPIASPPQPRDGDISSVEARLVPARDARLSFAVGGRVDEILVSEGDHVEAGDPMVRLDADSQTSALEQAEAGLAAAEARLQSAEAELASARAGVSTAELGVLAANANLALIKTGALPEEIAAAEQEIEAAQAGVTEAAAGRDASLEIPESQIRAAEANVAAARAELEAVQESYNAIIDACFDLPTGETICPLYGTVEENTRGQLEVAQLNVESAQAALDALNAGATAGQRQAASGAVVVALANQELAEAQLELILAGPSDEEIRRAEVQVDQAEEAVQQARTAVDLAQSTVSQAEAEVVAARSNVAAAQAAFDRTTLKAVFPGTVSSVDAELGQLVSSGVPVVVLADLDDWLVETTDLSELDIARVEIGAPAVVELDAIPGEIVNGVVSDIARVPKSGPGGDVIYLVTIDLEDRPDLPLRWRMTASVDIVAD